MNLKPIKANMTELTLKDGLIKILFSYQTPVAYSELTPEGKIFYRTEEYYSRTTTKHIKSWLPYHLAIEIEQQRIDELVK